MKLARYLAATLVSAAVCWSVSAETSKELEAGFRQPPLSARPQTLWFWMNGNITRDGITRDLEAMKRAGLAGALIFEGGIYIPRGPVDYLSVSWRDLIAHAAREANRLGLELGMHNGPGWSSSGGPWITPEYSMQQLVWTETTVTGPRHLELDLPHPYAKEGFYREAFVLAFPAAPGEEQPFQDHLKRLITALGTVVSAAALTDGDLTTSVRVGPGNALILEFAEPFEACAVTVYAGAGASTARVAIEASDDGTTYRPVTQINLSPPRGIEFPGVKNFPAVRASFFRLVPQRETSLAEVALHHAPRVEDWNFKGNFAFRLPRPTVQAADGGREFALDPKQVRDISSRLDAQGHLSWEVPPGSWVLLRLGHTSTGQRNVAAPTAGHGLECDKFSREAVETHFQSVQETVLKAVGPLGRKSLVRVSIDSYEAEMQNWTAAFPREFRKRNGYDLRPYLPAMTGRIVGDARISDRFLYDVRCTHADLMANNYYGHMAELCHRHGLRFYAEPYGPGPFDELKVGSRADVPMTEFWTRFPWGPNRVVKSVSSGAHIYGQRIVAAESFTGEEQTSRWEEYPYALKPLGDLMLSLGFNQAFFHRCVHQPHPDAAPGMTMGPWGIHFDRMNTWFEKSSGWLEYLARSQYLLQQGNFAADILFFVGERSPEVSQYAIPEIPAGYTYDLVNADVLLTRAKVRDGRIVLPEGTSYRLLVLPEDLKGMTPALLRKLNRLVTQGMVLLGPEPEFSLTLRGGAAAETEFHRLANELWNGAAEGHAYGKGRVFLTTPLPEVLHQLGIQPDFEFSSRNPDGAVVWLHRKLADAEIYFVANRRRRAEDVVCSLRVTGRQPELWNPETGEIGLAPFFSTEANRVRLPLHLEPAQSMFVVLRAPAAKDTAQSVSRDGVKVIQTQPFPAEKVGPFASISNSFTVSVWVKPDIELRLMPRETSSGRLDETGKNYVVPAREGDKLFGPGHALMGLAAGRNGVYVVERSSQSAPAVLVAKMPLSGWTHLAVVYQDGKPSLYAGGKFVREGLVSGNIVHPAVGVPPPLGTVHYFEGEMTRPDVFAKSLLPEEIQALAEKGLPSPDEPPPAELALRADGKVDALLWQGGAYALGDGPSVTAKIPQPLALAGPWSVGFPAGHGAPAGIVVPELISLHRHTNTAVRHFSGTATYSHSLAVAPEWLAAGRRVYLDLGRVEVIADVRVNGRDLGLLWKPPYRLDVTEAVHPGDNAIEVRVTTIWPNRLIGDEQLPPENEYDPTNRNIVRLPDWYAKGEPKPAGGRTTFATWKFYKADDPLLEGGLLGPVRLLNPVRRVLER